MSCKIRASCERCEFGRVEPSHAATTTRSRHTFFADDSGPCVPTIMAAVCRRFWPLCAAEAKATAETLLATRTWPVLVVADRCPHCCLCFMDDKAGRELCDVHEVPPMSLEYDLVLLLQSSSTAPGSEYVMASGYDAHEHMTWQSADDVKNSEKLVKQFEQRREAMQEYDASQQFDFDHLMAPATVDCSSTHAKWSPSIYNGRRITGVTSVGSSAICWMSV